jgi:prolyl oligopeptidase
MMTELSDVGTDVISDDPYRWLEDSTDERALDWARRRNAATLAELSGERFERMREEALEVYDSSDHIPSVKRRGEYLYNFWRDAEHPKGLWRRTTLEEFRKTIRTGMSSSTSTPWPPMKTRTGCGKAPTSSNPSKPAR